MTAGSIARKSLAPEARVRSRRTFPTEGSPIIGVCGWSGSGKTTLIEALIPRLAAKGLRVVAVKHDAHRLSVDRPGKDSDRFFEAGADVVAHDSLQIFSRQHSSEAFSLEETLAGLAESYDIVLVEGHKRTPLPKIWVEGPNGEPPPADVEGVLASLPRGAARLARAEELLVAWLGRQRAKASRFGGLRLAKASQQGDPEAEERRVTPEALIDAVRERMRDRVAAATSRLGLGGQSAVLAPGKLLRSRLAGRVAARAFAPAPFNEIASVCAATELVHTASLCHDDVVDQASKRRNAPTLWTVAGTSTAILIGDMLLCDALALLAESGAGGGIATFTAKVREVCEAEAEQELLSRGRRLDPDACLDMARRKTGPLFAFPAMSCVADPGAAKELEEAGYEVGAAYQLADDWLDVAGTETASGKSLGSDARRDKFTLAQGAPGEQETLHRLIVRLLRSAVDRLSAWPGVQEGMADFLRLDFQPALARMHTRLEEDLRKAL